ncbi:DUF2878 domain-containing protein [Endozoicomonas lisbonensis]|uniref:DUF2878 domain-containing protein n=1 Tax=Endozoicomonas lisbonensis TaxID=3120522 RepID=A0ABV2SHQ8_9GAMM
MEMLNDMSENAKIVTAGAVFNLFWLVTVIGQTQYIWLSCGMLLISWWYIRGGFPFAVSLALPGIVMDVSLAHIGVYAFDEAFPVWLVVLWLGFSTFLWCIRKSILARAPVIIVALGCVGGTVSYLAGERLGAVTLALGLMKSAGIVAICWVLFSVLALWMVKIFDKFSYKDVNQ